MDPDDEVRDEPGPAGLVRGAQSRPVVTVEVLVELDVVPPPRIRAEPLDLPEARTPPVAADEEDRDQPPTQVRRDLPVGALLPRAGRVLDGDVVAVEAAEPLEGGAHEEVEGE